MSSLRTLRRLVLAEGGLPLVWVALTALLLVPVWNQRLLPMLDTPNHLALVRGWHSYYDPSYRIAEYYTLRIRPVPYFLYYASMHLMMFAASIETANKLFLSAYLVLFPLSVLALARVLGRSPWLALGAFALAFNRNWIYGFSSYLMGTCFMLLAFTALISFLREGRERDLLLVSVLCLLTYLSHVLPWAVFGAGAIALLIYDRRRWRRGLSVALAVSPSVLLMACELLEEQGERAYLKQEKFAAVWRDFPTLVKEFPGRILEIFPGKLDTEVLIVLAATVVALCAWKGVRASGEGAREQKQLRILIWVLIGCYLLLPYEISKPMWWWSLSQRMPSLIMTLLLLLPLGRLTGRQRLVMVPLMVACVALPLRLTRLYRDFNARNLPMIRLLNEIPRGASTILLVRGTRVTPEGIELSGDPASSGPVYWQFSSWPMALNGGYGPHVFDQGIPIRPKKRLKAPGWPMSDNFDIRQAPEFDYYLIKNAPDVMTREPALRVADQIGDWTLFERVYPITDEP
jgi:hypothetical protein